MKNKRLRPFGFEQFVRETHPLMKHAIFLVGELHFGLRVRKMYLSRIFRKSSRSKFQKILDVGSAKGQMAFWLARSFPDSIVTGLEINSQLVQHCSQISRDLNLKNITFAQGDVREFISNQEYDLILCVDVLEHIEEWEIALANLIRALKPDGTLIVHVPHSSEFLDSRFGVRKLLRNNLSHTTEIGAPHVRDGFKEDDFFILNEYPVEYHVGYSFGPLTMYLHTIFEAYRGSRRYWHLVFTPLLAGLAQLEVNKELSRGGGLLLEIRKRAG